MLLEKKGCALLCLSLVLALFAGCETKQKELKADKTELVYASTKDIRNINPHLYGGEMSAQNMVFESLVMNTHEGVKPWLAERWDISSDGKSYTFYLRKDVKFSDGSPFDATVVKKNIDAV
ncbi:MAG: nickel ABC transporter, nickel/metallophore periplasmic binding protein, partial [Epsilonproteobacteria bacterium]|nr:nickel ABC transporter, nickel/metallophore periplasmic binding protein [Campylobacterota bacterium]